jgi:hypothetical protein
MKFHVKKAVIMAIRAFCITVPATVTAMPVAHSLSDFRSLGIGWLFALYTGATAAVFAFLANLVEDNTTINLGTKSFTTASATRQA